MFNDLELYLQNVVSPEHAEVLMRGFAVLESSGVTSVGDYLYEFTSTINSRTTVESLDALEQLLIGQYEVVLNQFGIILEEEGLKIKILTEMLEGLNSITNYDDPISINDICLSDQEPENKLSDILMLVTPLTWADCLLTYESVSEALIVTIAANLSPAYVSDEIAEDHEHIRTRVRKFVDGNPNSPLLETVNGGLLIGMTMGYYIAAFNTYYNALDESDQRKVEPLANLLTGYGLLCKLPDSEVEAALINSLEDVFVDPDTQGKVGSVITNTIRKFLTVE